MIIIAAAIATILGIEQLLEHKFLWREKHKQADYSKKLESSYRNASWLLLLGLAFFLIGLV